MEETPHKLNIGKKLRKTIQRLETVGLHKGHFLATCLYTAQQLNKNKVKYKL